MTYTDTNRLLDACAQCGARAGFEASEDKTMVRARCTECCNCEDWSAAEVTTMFLWNVEQRKQRKGKNA